MKYSSKTALKQAHDGYIVCNMQKETIILGIDPGTNILGYGVIRIRGHFMELISCGTVKFDRKLDALIKLKHILHSMNELIDRFLPDEMAIESPFYGENVQSMLKLGRAQGIAIAVALSRNIPVSEYAPKRIKQSITGMGNASKEQVSAMASRLLNTKLEGATLDATDALGVAICHHLSGESNHSNQTPKNKAKGKSDWGSFVKNNPNKLKRS